VGVLPVRWWGSAGRSAISHRCNRGTLWQTAILINPAGVDFLQGIAAGRY